MLLLTVIGCVFGLLLFLSARAVSALYRGLPVFRDEATLATLAVIGGLGYGALVLVLLGRNWFRAFRGERRATAAALPSAD